jgi:hypothetical protein
MGKPRGRGRHVAGWGGRKSSSVLETFHILPWRPSDEGKVKMKTLTLFQIVASDKGHGIQPPLRREREREREREIRGDSDKHNISNKAKTTRLMLFRKQSLFIVRTIRNTQIQFVPLRKHIHYVCATETNRLTLFRETVGVYCESHMEHIYFMVKIYIHNMLMNVVCVCVYICVYIYIYQTHTATILSYRVRQCNSLRFKPYVGRGTHYCLHRMKVNIRHKFSLSCF